MAIIVTPHDEDEMIKPGPQELRGKPTPHLPGNSDGLEYTLETVATLLLFYALKPILVLGGGCLKAGSLPPPPPPPPPPPHESLLWSIHCSMIQRVLVAHFVFKCKGRCHVACAV